LTRPGDDSGTLYSRAGGAAAVLDAFDLAPLVLIALAGHDHRVTAANKACRELIGRSDVIGLPIRQVLPELAGQRLVELLDQVYETGEPATGREWRLRLDHGQGLINDACIDFTVVARRSADGAVAGLVGAGFEVTERIRARLAAQQRGDGAERQYPAGRDVVAALQEALLPSGLPVLPQARIAARYLAACREQAAGGDWFDAIPLADGTVALIVGDVVGRGVATTAAMAQLRAVLNEMLAAERDLAAVLARVDACAARTPMLRAATLAVAVLDPAGGGLRYSTCGHPAPLVIGGNAATRFLPPTGNGPLGTGSVPVLAYDRLQPEEVLLLYSDGLVERPGRTFAQSTAELAAVAADAAANRVRPAGPEPTASERVCQLTVELLTRAGYADDVVTLAAERMADPVPPLHLKLPCEVPSLTAVRRALDHWLAGIAPLAEDRDAVHMAVVEIVTNAILHAYPPGQPGSLEFDLALRTDGQLECLVSDYGSWRAPDPGVVDRGNGLMVAEHMVDRMLISHPAQADGAPDDAAGTVVTLLHRVRRPVMLASGAGAEATTFPAWPLFTVDAEIDGQVACAWVRGPVDISTADEFLRKLLAACRGGTLPLTVDLTAVTQLASAGVSALYQLTAQLAAHGHRLTLLTGAGSPARAVLDLVRLPCTTAAPTVGAGSR
jgi:serine phosphatase RsbU (regulator of sigma subunit)/anti-sigma regulatory factor (Ser/Thr protein kinase)/anti-anti-sigma regulatory factor